MKLRNGNNEKREYSASIGVIGMEATLEGPFSKNYNGSYLINYRYSSLAILDNLGIVDYYGIPYLLIFCLEEVFQNTRM